MTREKADMLFLVRLWGAGLPYGVPLKHTENEDVIALALEQRGLVERHHVGRDGKGTTLTEKGREVCRAMVMEMLR